MGISHLLQASGQSVAKIQLTEEEAKTQARFPVVFDMSNGHYVLSVPSPPSLQSGSYQADLERLY